MVDKKILEEFEKNKYEFDIDTRNSNLDQIQQDADSLGDKLLDLYNEIPNELVYAVSESRELVDWIKERMNIIRTKMKEEDNNKGE